MPTCSGPGCTETASNKCSRCKAVFYCSASCQKADLKARHKQVCSKNEAANIIEIEDSEPPLQPFPKLSDRPIDISLAKLVFSVDTANDDVEMRLRVRAVNKEFKKLLDQGASVDCVVKLSAQLPISIDAAGSKKLRVIEYSALLGLCRQPGLLPLLEYALDHGKVASLDHLLPAVSWSSERAWESPLLAALYNSFSVRATCNSGAVRLLLNHGANPNLPAAIGGARNDAMDLTMAAIHGKRVIFYPLHVVTWVYGVKLDPQAAVDPSLGPGTVAKHVEWLLSAGADINIRSYPFKQTPLHDAIPMDPATQPLFTPLALQMIAAGADVHATSAIQFRPLDCAAMQHNTTVFKALIAAGADPRPRPFAVPGYSLPGEPAVYPEGHESSAIYLQNVIQHDQHEIVASAIAAGVKVWEYLSQDSHAITMLETTVSPPFLSVKCLHEMISGGADVNKVFPRIGEFTDPATGTNVGVPGTLWDLMSCWSSKPSLSREDKAKVKQIKEMLAVAGAKSAAQLAREAKQRGEAISADAAYVDSEDRDQLCHSYNNAQYQC